MGSKAITQGDDELVRRSAAEKKSFSVSLPSTSWLWVIGLILLTAWPRLTALNQYLIVDEADRWRWAENFVYALHQGNLAGTRVGDGYPGIIPVWAESIWIFLEAARRSVLEGGWIGEAGLYLIFHEWDRSAFLYQQRLPIVLLNTVLALLVIGAVWHLFGKQVALIGGILIALDPFYLSDSRVNRAEAVITGLITLSILALIFYYRRPRLRYLLLSGIFGGLSFLTKIQALAMLPAIFLIGLFVVKRMNAAHEGRKMKFSSLIPHAERLSFIYFCLGWVTAAGLTWFILWPAMWVIPGETLSLVYDYTTRKVGAEGVNLFFMGQTYADADPGPIFYPFVFLMRLTPLALLGFIVYVAMHSLPLQRLPPPASRLSFILVIYILVYTIAMTLGSHKQDRYLLPIFLSVDILAAIGLVSGWHWLKRLGHGQQSPEGKVDRPTPHLASLLSAVYGLLPTPFLGGAIIAILLLSQLATVLPHHPYYYSFFNPLLGNGQTAVRTLRIGWGEGMDQVGAYLAAKPNSRSLVVASRFTHNMLGFKGERISLLPDGRWTQADYIVLYIQQVQRRQEPGPAFIDYFQARPPEKVITIGGINYAWIYPRPFTTPANPAVSFIRNQAALLGYRWESAGQLRLFWESFGLEPERQLSARLRGPARQTDWAACSPDPAVSGQARNSGAIMESICSLPVAGLSPGTYSVEFGLATTSPAAAAGEVELFTFPEGWQAATVTAAGTVVDTPEQQRLEAVAGQMLPASATRLDRNYDGRLKLVAYQLDPPAPQPGQTVKLTLYWQRVKEVLEPVRLTVQLADSRSLPLGRLDTELSPQQEWLLGQLVPTVHPFQLATDLKGPLAAQVEVILRNPAEIPLQPTTTAGEALAASTFHFTVAPEQWPTLAETKPVTATWQNNIGLAGYTLSPATAQPGDSLGVNLFWQTGRPVAENYMIFVHLLAENGQIIAQNDSLPRAGAYPTPWWQPGTVVEDTHTLTLPPDLAGGTYHLVVGLYRPGDGVRLPLKAGGDGFTLGEVEIP